MLRTCIGIAMRWLERLGHDWFNPKWFTPENLYRELTKPSVRRTLTLMVFTLLCVSFYTAPVAAAVDSLGIDGVIWMLDIQICVAAAMLLIPLKRLCSLWIKPATVAHVRARMKLRAMLMCWCFGLDHIYESLNTSLALDRG